MSLVDFFEDTIDWGSTKEGRRFLYGTLVLFAMGAIGFSVYMNRKRDVEYEKESMVRNIIDMPLLQRENAEAVVDTLTMAIIDDEWYYSGVADDKIKEFVHSCIASGVRVRIEPSNDNARVDYNSQGVLSLQGNGAGMTQLVSTAIHRIKEDSKKSFVLSL